MERYRKIAVQDFFDSGQHIYEDQLGFDEEIRYAARSNVSKDIFVSQIDELHFELAFYYVDDNNFYFVTPMETPFQVLKINKHPEWSRFIGWQSDTNSYDDGVVIAEYDTAKDIWNNFRINGKSMEEIIHRSYILMFC